MKTMVGLLGSFVLGFSLIGTANAQEDQAPAQPQPAAATADQAAAQPALPPPPPSAPPPADAQPSAPPPQGAQDVAPPMQQRVYSYPTGQWVYADGEGWVWVPNGASTTYYEGAPYAYLYTPSYGWTWYVSPWGVGPYVYGAWVHHPWHPAGLHGYWVARPGVVRRFARHR